jgi:hypothetical protein
MKKLLAFLLMIPLIPAHAAAPARVAVRTFAVRGPTVIAFFAPNAKGDYADESEALDDFQWYAMQVNSRMKAAGIDFHVVYARSFRAATSGHTQVFTTKDNSCGYYLVMPGEKPRIEYGVMTDDDLMEFARETFGNTSKSVR